MAGKKKRSDGSSWDELKTQYWPSVDTPKGALEATTLGISAAVVIAAFSGAVGAWSWYSGREVLGLDSSILVDAGVFAILAIGMKLNSRSAAFTALSFYLAGQVWSIYSSGQIPIPILSLMFITLLINGIRGTVAFHRLRAQETSNAEND